MKEWWRHRTLRFRLALWYAVGGVLLLAGFSATVYFYVAGTLGRPLAQNLAADLTEVRRHLTVQPDGNLLWDGARLPDGAHWPAESPWFELWDKQGNLVKRLWPLTPGEVAEYPSAPPRGRETLSIFRVAPTIRLRVYSVPYEGPGVASDWMIRVISIHEPVADALGALRWIIAIVTPMVVALLVLGGYALTHRWLSPLDALVAEASRISVDDFSRRLPVANPHDELGRLAAVFNVTLDRLERSYDTLGQFVSDASHELRTPLTTLRSVGEVGLRRSRTVEEYREIIGSMLEEGQRLQQLVQRLLELASAEGGLPAIENRTIQLDEFVRACVGELSILAEYRDQKIVIETCPCTVETDPMILRQALQNLMDNAFKYSPSGTSITVVVESAGVNCTVSVSDQGPGIPAEDRLRIMDRFFRVDNSRERRKGGFGIGLALTKAYLQILGGAVAYAPVQPTGSRFTLTLPREPKHKLRGI